MGQDMAVARDQLTGVAEARDTDAAWVLVMARDVGGGRIVSNAFVLITIPVQIDLNRDCYLKLTVCSL
jgi:hypothetical protein